MPTVPLILRPVPESRPTARRWGPTVDRDRSGPDQPSLFDALDVLDVPGVPDRPDGHPSAPRPRGVRILPEAGPGSIPPAPGLPDPGAWSAALGLAVGQAIVGVRPAGQLQSWLDVAVLADLRCAIRQRLRSRGRAPAGRSPRVRVASVRTQCPTPDVVEAAIHVRIGARSLALGARLEAVGSRWLCTALAGPATGTAEISGLPIVRDTA